MHIYCVAPQTPLYNFFVEPASLLDTFTLPLLNVNTPLIKIATDCLVVLNPSKN